MAWWTVLVTDMEDLPERAYDRTVDLNHTNPTERRGVVVTHPAQPWTSTVHAYLRHLESVGFEAAPRVVGTGFDDAGDEVLGWIEGEVFARSVWPDPAGSLHEVGVMLRRLHAAGRDFTPPPQARWMPWSLHSGGAGAVVSHGNVAPWHVVFLDRRPVGLIGWEYAGPVDPVDEVAVTGWYCCQLFDDDVAGEIGLPGAEVRAEWFRGLLDGYGLARAERVGLVDRIRWTVEHRDVLERAALA